ncbi:MAG: MoaD/ThiS family protein [Planctomycetaceae bacterium]
MSVTVEFFGIARQRAGVAAIEVDAGNLGEAFDRLAQRLPHWADACLAEGHLRPAFLANLNARTFVLNRSQPLREGDRLLILAADVGG